MVIVHFFEKPDDGEPMQGELMQVEDGCGRTLAAVPVPRSLDDLEYVARLASSSIHERLAKALDLGGPK